MNSGRKPLLFHWRHPLLPALKPRRLRNFLTGRFPPAKLAAVLLSRDRWHPFPTAAERSGWNAVPAEIQGELVAAGEQARGAGWPALPATLFLEYARIGNRSHYEKPWFERRARLRELVMAEAAESKGRFLDAILDCAWSICEETFWGLPAHLGLQKAGPGLPDISEPTVDLFAAETGALMSWTLYLLGPALERASPLAPQRIRSEVDRRILTPNLTRDFGWMKLGMNWNPWIDSNWLTCALLVEPDANRRLASVSKALECLDSFLNQYPEDGGCDEGPSYWSRAGGSLFDCLELLHSASGGAIDLYSEPLIGAIGQYIYRAHIHDDWFINFADASAKLGVAGDLIFRYGRRIGDEKMAGFGAWALANQNQGRVVSDSIGRQLPAVFNTVEVRKAPQSQSLERDIWLPNIQVMAARVRQGSADGLYLAAQGGHNAEAHNHNDVGNFIVFSGGEPLLIDVGVETYSAKTFSDRRYDIWTMQSAYHNLPTINGVMQAAGRQFAAHGVSYRSNDESCEFSLDIAKAYPPEAGLEQWRRTLRLDRALNRIEVADEYSLSRTADEITLTLMTPCRVLAGSRGRLSLDCRSGSVDLAFDAGVFESSTEDVRIDDARLKPVWGDRIYRVLLKARKPPRRASWLLRIG